MELNEQLRDWRQTLLSDRHISGLHILNLFDKVGLLVVELLVFCPFVVELRKEINLSNIEKDR